MRLRLRLRTLLLGVALLAVGLAVWMAIERRSKQFTRLAAYHLQAHEILVDQAGGPLQCLQVEGDDTWETAADKRFSARGERQYLASKASTYHWNLFEKWRKAAESPWLSVEVDPPSPPMANPPFDADSSYDQIVLDWDKPQPGSLK
jgi:hypothetical protein